MANYDFNASMSPVDFELLSKELLEAELNIRLENFGQPPIMPMVERYPY